MDNTIRSSRCIMIRGKSRSSCSVLIGAFQYWPDCLFGSRRRHTELHLIFRGKPSQMFFPPRMRSPCVRTWQATAVLQMVSQRMFRSSKSGQCRSAGLRSSVPLQDSHAPSDWISASGDWSSCRKRGAGYPLRVSFCLKPGNLAIDFSAIKQAVNVIAARHQLGEVQVALLRDGVQST